MRERQLRAPKKALYEAWGRAMIARDNPGDPNAITQRVGRRTLADLDIAASLDDLHLLRNLIARDADRWGGDPYVPAVTRCRSVEVLDALGWPDINERDRWGRTLLSARIRDFGGGGGCDLAFLLELLRRGADLGDPDRVRSGTASGLALLRAAAGLVAEKRALEERLEGALEGALADATASMGGRTDGRADGRAGGQAAAPSGKRARPANS